ncbi:ribosome hibernation-promoting factor, HPF/YfiA family [Gemmatimonadota bacterium]
MKTSVTARHFDLSTQVHDHAISAMEGLEKYFDRIVDAHIILVKENNRWRAEARIGVPGETLTAESEGEQLFNAIDDVSAKTERQLKKYKAKVSHERDRRSMQKLNSERPEIRQE